MNMCSLGRLETIDGRIEPVKKQGNYLNEYGITVSSEELITYINILRVIILLLHLFTEAR